MPDIAWENAIKLFPIFLTISMGVVSADRYIFLKYRISVQYLKILWVSNTAYTQDLDVPIVESG